MFGVQTKCSFIRSQTYLEYVKVQSQATKYIIHKVNVYKIKIMYNFTVDGRH